MVKFLIRKRLNICLQSSSITLRSLSRVCSIVKFIETFRLVSDRLVLDSGHILNLEEIIYVSSLRRNLIYVFRLHPFDMMSFLRVLVMVLIWMNLLSLSIFMVILLVLICWLMIYSNWRLMHHMSSFYQISVPLIMFCLLLENVLRCSYSLLSYGINVLGMFPKGNCILLWREVFLII